MSDASLILNCGEKNRSHIYLIGEEFNFEVGREK